MWRSTHKGVVCSAGLNEFGALQTEAPHLANEVLDCLHTTPPPLHYEMFYS